MSNGYSGSFDASDFDDQIWTSCNSSQSTQATELAFDDLGPISQQTSGIHRASATTPGFSYGTEALAGIATNPNIAFGNGYGPPSVRLPIAGPNHIAQVQNELCNAEPWSPYFNLRVSAPCYYWQGPSAAGPGQLSCPPMAQHLHPSAFGVLPPASNGSLSTESNPTLPQQPPQQFGPSPKMLLPRETPSLNQQPKPSSNVPQPGFACPTCQKVCSRPDVVQRHIETIHKRSPFYWRCLTCGHWEHSRRKDKMQDHCSSEHGQQEGHYRFDQVSDVGEDYDQEPKPSYNGKETRRTKKRLPTDTVSWSP